MAGNMKLTFTERLLYSWVMILRIMLAASLFYREKRTRVTLTEVTQ